MNKTVTIALVVLVFVVGGLYVISSNFYTPTTATDPDTIVWATYKNEEYGFEVLAPERWLSFGKPGPLFDDQNVVIMAPSRSRFGFSENAEEYEFLNDIDDRDCVTYEGEVFVAKVKGERYRVICGDTIVLFVPENRNFFIELYAAFDSELPILEDMLSTFKFID